MTQSLVHLPQVPEMGEIPQGFCCKDWTSASGKRYAFTLLTSGGIRQIARILPDGDMENYPLQEYAVEYRAPDGSASRI